MPKVMIPASEPHLALFWCPGCDEPHGVAIHGIDGGVRGGHSNSMGATWAYSGTTDAPTFNPSIFIGRNDPARRCHSVVREGRIQFFVDCHHALRGMTVSIPEWE